MLRGIIQKAITTLLAYPTLEGCFVLFRHWQHIKDEDKAKIITYLNEQATHPASCAKILKKFKEETEYTFVLDALKENPSGNNAKQ